jgi:hypothetical protein
MRTSTIGHKHHPIRHPPPIVQGFRQGQLRQPGEILRLANADGAYRSANIWAMVYEIRTSEPLAALRKLANAAPDGRHWEASTSPSANVRLAPWIGWCLDRLSIRGRRLSVLHELSEEQLKQAEDLR